MSNIIGSSKALANIPCMQVQISTSNKAHSSVSTISKYVCTISGGNNNSFSRTYEAQESQSDVLIDLGAITEYGRYSISVYAVDARGISSSPVVKQNAFEVIDYHVPLATTFELKRLGNFEKEVSLNVVCNISRVSGYNTSFTSYYRYCRTGTSMPLSWTTITNIQDGGIDGSDYKKIIINSNFLTLEKGESYDFQFKFKDRFSEVVINPSLSQGVAPLSVYEDGTVAINRVPDFNQTDRAKLQIDGDIMINRNSDSEEVFVAEELYSLRETVDSLSSLNELTKSIYLLMHPIGSIVMTTKNESPEITFGGKWIAWGSGRVPIGVDETQEEFKTTEKTGGEKEHWLSIHETPSHTHPLEPNGQAHSFAWGAKKGNVYVAANAVGGASPSNTNYLYTQQNTWNQTGSSGSTQPHNNLQPYITCYMWKRTE